LKLTQNFFCSARIKPFPLGNMCWWWRLLFWTMKYILNHSIMSLINISNSVMSLKCQCFFLIIIHVSYGKGKCHKQVSLTNSPCLALYFNLFPIDETNVSIFSPGIFFQFLSVCFHKIFEIYFLYSNVIYHLELLLNERLWYDNCIVFRLFIF